MKKYRLRLLVYVAIFITLLATLSFTCYSSWGMIIENKNKVKELTSQYEELLEKEDNLETEVVKLQDPEYVAKYAREKYLYTKDGEVVIDMTSLED